MTALTQTQIDAFWKNGVITIDNAVTATQLRAMKAEFDRWVEESRDQTKDYGETLDGRPRFDLQPGHSRDTPALRRIQSPEEISQTYADVMRSARTVDLVAQLIGPAIKFHHGKINSKLPGTSTQVKFHQDFTFQPMSNDDMITALLFIDDVTLENGPLEVVPGSHRGPLYTLWHQGKFTGAVDEQIVAQQKNNIAKCTGAAGSACLMHASLLHGSAANLSGKPRTLYISTYYAEDAIELSPNALPSTLSHELVRGERSGRVRCSAYEMELPEVPKDTSFFAQQEAGSA